MKQRRATTNRTIRTTGNWDMQPKRLDSGYDPIHDAGVHDGRYTSCNSTVRKLCTCYGCQHDNQLPGFEAQIVERRKGGIHFSATPNAVVARPVEAKPSLQNSLAALFARTSRTAG